MSESAHRPPKALSERSISTREVCEARESQRADMACGISEISRPVKMSAKSATYTSVSGSQLQARADKFRHCSL